jgi:hypothetical protein
VSNAPSTDPVRAAAAQQAESLASVANALARRLNAPGPLRVRRPLSAPRSVLSGREETRAAPSHPDGIAGSGSFRGGGSGSRNPTPAALLPAGC